MYYLERKGRIPSPPRDHAGKRVWAKKDVRKLKRKLRKGQSSKKKKRSPVAKDSTATASETDSKEK